jgi:uncharacterized membrane protein
MSSVNIWFSSMIDGLFIQPYQNQRPSQMMLVFPNYSFLLYSITTLTYRLIKYIQKKRHLIIHNIFFSFLFMAQCFFLIFFYDCVSLIYLYITCRIYQSINLPHNYIMQCSILTFVALIVLSKYIDNDFDKKRSSICI